MPRRLSLERLNQLAQQRVLVIDSAMDAALERQEFTEDDYRGDRFANHATALAGNHCVLSLTQRQIVASVHRRYLDAGADIITTNTSTANLDVQSACGLAGFVHEINFESTRLARSAADEATAEWPSQPRLAAGAIRASSSASPDAYVDQIRGLIDGGADLLLIDIAANPPSLAAVMEAVQRVCASDSGAPLPVIVTADRGNASAEQLIADISSAMGGELPWAISIKWTPERIDAHDYAAQLAARANCWICIEQIDAAGAQAILDASLVNVIGGTNPDTVRSLAESVQHTRPRVIGAAAASAVAPGELLTLDQARANHLRTNWGSIEVAVPWFIGRRVVSDQRLEEILPLVNWPAFFNSPAPARELIDRTQQLLKRIVSERKLQARAVYGFWPANSDRDDVIVYKDDGRHEVLARFHMLRQQEADGAQARLSLADFIAPVSSHAPDYIGVFALTTGAGLDALVKEYEDQGDAVSAQLVKSLAEHLADAFAEFVHKTVRDEWGFGRAEHFSADDLFAEKYRGMRAAFGSAECPDRVGNKALFDLLMAQNLGIKLSSDFSVSTPASRSGLFFSHPDAVHFALGRIGDDQRDDYARRKSP